MNSPGMDPADLRRMLRPRSLYPLPIVLGLAGHGAGALFASAGRMSEGMGGAIAFVVAAIATGPIVFLLALLIAMLTDPAPGVAGRAGLTVCIYVVPAMAVLALLLN